MSNAGFRIWPVYPIVQVTSETVLVYSNERLEIFKENKDPQEPLLVGNNYEIYLNFYSIKS